jgi:hypothetical protein
MTYAGQRGPGTALAGQGHGMVRGPVALVCRASRAVDLPVRARTCGRPSDLYELAGKLSPHLCSRAEVGDILLASGVPTAALQAAVIIGSGSRQPI